MRHHWSRTNRLSLLAAAVCLLASGFTSPASVQAQEAADATKSKPTFQAMVGLFLNESVKYEGYVVDGELLGQITQGDQVVRFTSRLQGEEVELTLRLNGKASKYMATIKGDNLTLQAGLQSIKLKRIKATASLGNVKLNAKPLVKATDMVESTLTVSPDSQRVAYMETHKDHRRVVIDGEPGKPLFHATRIQFSADSKRVAYIAYVNDKWHVVVDRQHSEPHDEINPASLRFSQDGKHIGYFARRGDTWHAIIDGKAGPAYDTCRSLTFSHDGKHVAYTAFRDNQWRNVIDGQESKPATQAGPVKFSPDGKRFAFGITRGSSEFVVKDNGQGDRKETPVDGIVDLMFGPSDQRFAMVQLIASRYAVELDGKPGEAFDRVTYPTFSPNGRRFAYRARREGVEHVVTEDGMSEPFQQAGRPIFSANSQSLAFAVVKVKPFHVVMNGKLSKPYERVRFIALSPNGRRLAFVAKTGGAWTVVVDGKAGKLFDSIHPSGVVFSPDSTHVAYVGTRLGKRTLVVDGITNPLDRPILPQATIHFDDKHRFHTLVQQGPLIQKLSGQVVK